MTEILERFRLAWRVLRHGDPGWPRPRYGLDGDVRVDVFIIGARP